MDEGAAEQTAPEPAAAARPNGGDGLGEAVKASAGTPTACLPSPLRGALRDTAARFGALTLVSTTSLHSENHARGSARAKAHADCQAVDFRPPDGKLKQVVAYLKSRRDLGGIEGYRDNVVHIDAKAAPTVARSAPVRKVARRAAPAQKRAPREEQAARHTPRQKVARRALPKAVAPVLEEGDGGTAE